MLSLRYFEVLSDRATSYNLCAMNHNLMINPTAFIPVDFYHLFKRGLPAIALGELHPDSSIYW